MKQSLIRKVLVLGISLSLTLSMVACGGSPAKTVEEKAPESPPAEAAEAIVPDKATDEIAPLAKPVSIGALKGPTALGMVGMMEKNEYISSNLYSFSLAGAPDELVGKIVSGELDIAAVPTNLAATLFQKTNGGVKLAAVNTLGVLYILEKGDSITSVKDLEGKTIYATGQGATPEYALNLVLSKNGLVPGENVTVEYRQEHAEIAPLLASGEATVALLPQPFVTSVLMKNPDVRVALDLTKEWDKATDSASALTMGSIIVRSEFLEENEAVFQRFLDDYKDSVALTTSPETMSHAAELSEKYDIMPKAVAEKAIPECNIVFVEGKEMKKLSSGFLQVLFDANPKSVGGKLPDESFYYIR